MVSYGTVRIVQFTALFSLPIVAALTLLHPLGAARAQQPPQLPSVDPTLSPAVPQDPQQPPQLPSVDPTLSPAVPQDPAALPSTEEDLRPLAQDSSFLSLQGGQRLISEASAAAAAQDYQQATKKYQQAREVFNQLSNFHQQLAGSFSGIDNRIADSHRRLARDTAQMRDDATYQLALVHRAENQPELAVPLLIQIIKSQDPTRDLGKKAYQQLFEIGFVDSPYPPTAQGQPSSSTPR